MRISQLAAATLVPATVAGIVFSVMPFAQASPAPAPHRVAHHAVHHAAAARAVKPAKATAAAKAGAKTHAGQQHTTATGQAAAPAPAQTTPPAPAATQTQPATTSKPMTAGMSSFEQCVAWHESGDNPTASSAGLFGILPATWHELGYSGTAGGASVAMQKVAFQRLYSELGTSPWAPYDGC